jgi:formylglycine-generating enzyme required for sulfatase activity
MKNLIVTIFILGTTIPCLSQQITNTDFYQSGKKLVITYDLIEIKASQTFDISLYVSTDNGSTWQGPLEEVSGDVGQNIIVGSGSSIVWNTLREFAMLKGKVGFRVVAKVNDKNLPEMVFVKGGTFQMGSNDGEYSEKPVHTVTLDDFYIGKYEVTQKEWREIMGTNPSYFKDCDNCPVERVSWDDVQEFLKKLNRKTGKNYRLPTEAEWEYAARGGNQSNDYKYAGTNDKSNLYRYANFADKNTDYSWSIETQDDGYENTAPVGSYQPNELGIYDMSGNVREWCSDWYGSDYYKNSSSNNPKGANSGPYRVLRGGAWSYLPAHCRIAFRLNNPPAYRSNGIGFRVVFP